MTTIAEQKAKIQGEIESLAQSLLNTRKQVLDELEFGDEMLDDSSMDGITTDYLSMAKNYAKQRAILKGLTVSDIVTFDLGAPSFWSDASLFTRPTTTKFGYVVVDDNGDEVSISDASLYYLTKRSADDVLASSFQDAVAYATPRAIPNSSQNALVGSVDGAFQQWQATTAYDIGQTILPTVSNGFFFRAIARGTSGGSEPTWPLNVGGTVTDGDVVWRCEGTNVQTWANTTPYAALDRVSPATPNGHFFKADPIKKVQVTLSNTPERLAGLAATLQPSSAGTPVTRVGSWGSGLVFNSGAGTNRALLFLTSYENTVASPIQDTGITTVTYGNQELTRYGTVVAAGSETDRMELWVLDEAGIAAAEDNIFRITYTNEDPEAAVHLACVYQDVDQEVLLSRVVTSSQTTPPPYGLDYDLTIALNTMQVSGVLSSKTDTATWANGWTEQASAEVASPDLHLSVADHDDTVGTTGGSEPTWPTTFGDTVVDGTVTWRNVGTTSLSATLALFPVVTGTVVVKLDGVQIGTDDGAGNVTGTGFSGGTINYSTGALDLTFDFPLVLGQIVEVVYTGIVGLAEWQNTYEQVDFTLTSKTYGSSSQFTLLQISVSGGVLSAAPNILGLYRVRAKKDHSVLGTLVVLVEGLKLDSTWDPINDSAENATEVSHSEFKLLMGYADPDATPTNDIVKSANPDNISTGKKETGPTYPDIEKAPFFPATDGTITGDAPYTTNFVHIEDGSPIWQVLPRSKWLLETKSTLATTQPPVPDDPGTVLSGLQAIIDVSLAGTNPVPADTGVYPSDGTVNGETSTIYTLNGSDQVVETVYRWDDPPGEWVITSQGLFSCLWNDLQALKVAADGLDFLKTQVDAIQANTFTNTIDTGQQTSDSQFITDTGTFETELDDQLAYHVTTNYHPINDRPTAYDTTDINALKTAANNTNGYRKQVTDRLAEINDDVLGDFTPSAGLDYVLLMYNAGTLATHKGIGWLRKIITPLNSVQRIYDTIIKKQTEYGLLP